MTTYKLQSANFVSAPGLIAWAIDGYFFEADRPQLLRVVCDTWGIPEDAAKSLLSGETPWDFADDADDETVVFTFPNEVAE